MPKTVRGPNGIVINFPDDTDEATINRVMSEAYAKQQSEQTAPVTDAETTPGVQDIQVKESGLTKFGRGLTRLPQLVGIGGDGQEARAKFASGATKALEATGRGVLKPFGNADDAVIAGISEGLDVVTGNETGTFKEKFEKSRDRGKQLEQENPLSSFIGQAYGFGRTGAALRNVGASAGLKVGIGAEAGTLAGASSLAEGDDLQTAALNAATGVVAGKALQGFADKVVVPAAQYVAGRINPALKSSGLSASVVNGIANRTKQPAEDVAAAINEFKARNGYTPSLAEIANPETVIQYAKLARLRQPVATEFRAAEESAALARPDRVGAAIEDTGGIARGVDEVAGVESAARAATQNAKDDATRAAQATADELRASKTALRDETRAAVGEENAVIARTTDELADNRAMVRDEAGKLIDEQKTNIARTADELAADKAMVKTESEKLVDLEKTEIGREGERLRQRLLEASKLPDDMASVRAIEAETKAWADNVMEGKGGLAGKKVDLDPERLAKTVPPQAMQKVLRSMRDASPVRTTKYKRLNKALQNFDEGKPVRLTVREIDNMRRSFNNLVGDDGVKFDLKDAAASLRDMADEQAKGYKDFLRKYSQFEQTIEGFKVGSGALTKGPNSLRVDIETMPSFGRAGASAGTLASITDVLGAGKVAPLRVAEQIVNRSDAIVAALGKKKGPEVVKMAEDALERVKTYTDEIAEIQEAAKNTTEGMTKGARERVAAAREEIAQIKEAANNTAAGMTKEARAQIAAARKRIENIQREAERRGEGMTAKATARVRELKRLASQEVRAIEAKFVRNRDALRAADNILNERNSNFDSAVRNAADENLPLGEVARGAIADSARQSPAGAIKTAEALRDTATQGRVAQVAGRETADTLAGIGRDQSRAAGNLNTIAVRGPADGVLSEEVSAALDVAATITGRAGAGFAANSIRRELVRISQAALSDKQAAALARAVTSNDPQLVNTLIDRLAKTQEMRKLIQDAINTAVVTVSAQTFKNDSAAEKQGNLDEFNREYGATDRRSTARPAPWQTPLQPGEGSQEEYQRLLTEGYTPAQAREIVAENDAYLAGRGR